VVVEALVLVVPVPSWSSSVRWTSLGVLVLVVGSVVVVGTVVLVVGPGVVVGSPGLVAGAVVVGAGGSGGARLVLAGDRDVVAGGGPVVRGLLRGGGVGVAAPAVTGERGSVVVVARRMAVVCGAGRVGGSAVADGSARAGPPAVPCGREVSWPGGLGVLTTPAMQTSAIVAVAAAADTIAITGRRRPVGPSFGPVGTTVDRDCCVRRWRARPSRKG
jgi:hypothetical protein